MNATEKTSLLAQIRELYRGGSTIQEISDELDVAYGAVRRWLVEAGIALRPAKRHK